MRRLSALSPAWLLLGLLLALACGPTDSGTPAATSLSGYAERVTETLLLVRQVHREITDPSVASLAPAAQQERYQAVDTEIRQKSQQLIDLEVPAEAQEFRTALLNLLDTEREIWVHLTLYSRTGQELHRVLATELTFAVDSGSRELAQQLLEVLEDQKVRPPDYLVVLAAAPAPVVAVPTAAPTVLPTATPLLPAPTEAVPSLPTPVPSLPPTVSEPTATLEPTVLPTPSPVPTAARPTPAPTPGPPSPPGLTLEGGFGELFVFKWVDRHGKPVLVGHWVINVAANTRAVADYAFVAGEVLDIQVWGDTVNAVYMLGPRDDVVFRVDQGNVTPLGNFGDIVTQDEGKYRIMVDNVGNQESREVHLTINYYTPAPGSIILEEDVEGLHFSLP
ncbi:MAG: hypothetical protein ACE5Q6_15800 [Dehalococcoidia bacterium]